MVHSATILKLFPLTCSTNVNCQRHVATFCWKLSVLRMPDAPTILCPPAGVSTGHVSAVPPTPVAAAPGTPAASEVPAPSDTPSGEAAKPEKPKKTPKRVKVEPVSPLEKGRDLEKQILTKKGECGNLTTQIRTLDFGGGLAQELSKYVEQFEFLAFDL